MISRKVLALWLLVGLMFSAVISGGCGGSNDDLDASVSQVNAAFNGGWKYKEGTGTALLTMNGQEVNMLIQDFGVLFSQSNIDTNEGEIGSVTMSAVGVFVAQNTVVPLLMDNAAGTTTRRSSNTWQLNIENGVYNFEMVSDDEIQLTGEINQSVGTIKISATMNKSALDENSQTANFASVLNGTWGTSTAENAQNGGGFLVVNGTPYLGTQVFASLAFSDTTASKTTCTGMGFMRTATTTGTEGLVIPVSPLNQEILITHMFANYYRFELTNIPELPMKGLLVARSASSAALIFQAENYLGEMHSLFLLEKKPDTNTLDVASYIGSSWDVKGSGTAISGGQIAPVVTSDGFTITLVSADNIGNVKLNFEGSLIASTGNVATPTVRTYDGTPAVFSMTQAGYNMVHASFESSEEIHDLIIAMIDEDNAFISDAAATADGSIRVTLCGQISRK